MRIVDTHTHFYDPSRPQGVPWPSVGEKLLYRTVLPGHYESLARPHDISGTVVVEASEWLEDNQWVLDLARENPFILGMVGHIRPGSTGFSANLKRFAADPIFRGIRIRGEYLDNDLSAGFVSDVALLASLDLSLDALAHEKHFDAVLQIAKAAPELRIIVNHIGHMPIDGNQISSRWMENYHRLATQPGISIKLSALPELSVTQPAPETADYYYPILKALWDIFGSLRLIFGSNWPVCEKAGDFSIGINVIKKFLSEKDDQANENIFWRNAKNFYKCEDKEENPQERHGPMLSSSEPRSIN